MNPPTKHEVLAVKLGVRKKMSMISKCEKEGRSLTAIVNELVDEYLETPIRPTIAKKNRRYAMRTRIKC